MIQDNNLTDLAKLILLDVAGLVHKTGYCWKSNGTFAKERGKSKRAISRAIGELYKHGYIQKPVMNYATNTRKIYLVATQKEIISLKLPNRVDNNGATGGQECPHNNNENIKQNDLSKYEGRATFNEIIFNYTKDPRLRQNLVEFVKMRCTRKNAPTNHALELLLADLSRHGPDLPTQNQIVETSIARGWLGFFPLASPPKSPPKAEIIRHEHNEKDLEGLVQDPGGIKI